jgi:hypothetical protein
MKIVYSDWEEVIVKKAFLPKEDLTNSERDILKISFDIFSSRLEDLTYLEDEVKRLTKENKYLKDLNEELIEESKNKNDGQE